MFAKQPKRLSRHFLAIVSALALFTVASGSAMTTGGADLSEGIRLFHERQWDSAMQSFLTVLKRDPSNREAHTYVDLIGKELAIETRQRVRSQRLETLHEAAARLSHAGKESQAIENALRHEEHSEEEAQEHKRRVTCEEARIEANLGHLLIANDLILKVLMDKSDDTDGQRLLSDLQSKLYALLQNPGELSLDERYAHEGFYAYDQADYKTAVQSWQKARALIDQNEKSDRSEKRLRELRFVSYETVAQAHLNEETVRHQRKVAFDTAVALYDRAHYLEALAAFRDLAIQEPDYPQLGAYLGRTEAAAEKERTKRLSRERKDQIAKLLQSAQADIEHERYEAAESSLQKMLEFDPAHPQALSYLALTRAELKKRFDPRAAQQHYEAGLIAYASGKLDEALREWHAAVKLDAHHAKAQTALLRAQKEIALDREPL